MPKKTTLTKILFLFFSLSIFFFTFNNAAAAGLIPCGLGKNDPCTLCHFIVGIKGLIDWGMGILVALSITGISIAGVLYVVSSGSSTLVTQAKGFITSVVIGFSLFLGAWLIINVILWLFAAKSDLGIQKDSWYSFSCSTVSSSIAAAPMGTDGIPVLNPVSCDNATFQTPDIKNQCKKGDASPELMNIISCMYNQLKNDYKALVINSISDNNGGATCYKDHPDWQQCTKDPQSNCCYHAKNSCHYGGTACAGASHAIDISKGPASEAEVRAVVSACKAKMLIEGTHYHISFPANCGCDTGLNFE